MKIGLPYSDLYRVPERIVTAIHEKQSDYQIDVANHADYFDFHLRLYLIGKHKTLHRVMYENRIFRTFHSSEAGRQITDIFNMLEEEILEKEYYELMKNLLHAKKSCI
jgi:hypothetical protein